MPSLNALVAFLAMASCALAVPAPLPQATGEVDPVGVLAPQTQGEGVELASASYPEGTFKATVLAHHNVHRANHSSPDIKWGADLATWAQKVANGCVWAHNTSVGNNGKGYGQNIAAGSPKIQISDVISDEFYNGEVNNYKGLYGQANPNMSNFENWGHFSQVVWAGSTQVGCAVADCTKKGGIKGLPADFPPYFTVCNYLPAGNVGGAYAKNIGKPKNQKTVTGTYSGSG